MECIYIHGSGGCSEAWQYQTDALAGAQAVNLPGHPDGSPCRTVEAYTEWLREYCVANDIVRPVLVGHSLGTAIAQVYSLMYPQEVSALVLIGGGARLRVAPHYLAMLENAIDDPTLFDGFLDAMWSTVDDGEYRETVMRRMKENGPAVFLNDMRACDAFDYMDRVHNITVPTLCICGSDDTMTPPKYTYYLADHIPAAETTIIDGGTHTVFAERPEDVNQTIAAFLQTIK